MDAAQLIELLNLKKHPEGGFFRETYRCEESVARDGLPARYSDKRSFGTCIYYLITSDTFSCMHRVSSDEIFHFYLGDPLEMLQLFPDGSSKVIKVGSNLLAGQSPQVLIGQGVWQGSRLAPGGKFALIGATVAPGFDFADYEEGSREELLKLCPDQKDLIIALTRI
jgi:predicted cupin superfamily sugar epimerase